MSGQQGGDLGKGGKSRFVPDFEKAAYALKVGELSQPVLSPFGFHIIRVDEHKGDTLALRHILVSIQRERLGNQPHRCGSRHAVAAGREQRAGCQARHGGAAR